MRDSSSKTSEFRAKRGLENLWYVHAGVEALPEELTGFASHISILLPWGSLLSAVARPDIDLLQKIACLCRPNATIRVVFGYDSSAEQKMIQELNLPILSEQYLNTTLTQGYRQAGFNIKWKFLQQSEIRNIGTTWAKKLAYGKDRRFVEINGKLLS